MTVTLSCPEDLSMMENIYLASNAITRQKSGSENNMLSCLSGFMVFLWLLRTESELITSLTSNTYVTISRICHFIDMHRPWNPNEYGILRKRLLYTYD